MKAVLLIDQEGPNPAYNRKAAQQAKLAGETYDVSPHITLEAGTEIDHPLCWIHCCRAEPTMRPADDECREKVHAYLNHPHRKAQLARLKMMAQPNVLKQLPPKMKEYVEFLAAKWLKPGDVSEDSTGDQPISDETLKFFDEGGKPSVTADTTTTTKSTVKK